MIVLFPSSPIKPKTVDDAFGYEARAAKEAGFHIGRVDLEIILGGEVKLAGVEEERGNILYRGWLMKPEEYSRIDQALQGRLVTNSHHYEDAYLLPHWCVSLDGHKPNGKTPYTIVLPKIHPQLGSYDLDRVAEVVASKFGDSGVILKDFVKSAKHRWYDACFIRSARDADEVKRVTKNFLDIAGDNLNGGLCYREFVDFKRIGIHSKTSMPLINEWRSFMCFGDIFYTAPYWAEGDYSGARPDPKQIEEMSLPLSHLPFIAVDIAEKENGDWMIVEVNDGGAAGVPEGGNTKEFFTALWKCFHNS